MKGTIRRLPDSELSVMQAIWHFDAPVTRAELEEQLTPGHPMAQTTLLTLLSRLADKGFVAVCKEGRGNSYSPIVTQEEYLASQSRRFVDQLCEGNMSLFANALCDGGLTRQELEELRTLLEEGTL